MLYAAGTASQPASKRGRGDEGCRSWPETGQGRLRYYTSESTTRGRPRRRRRRGQVEDGDSEGGGRGGKREVPLNDPEKAAFSAC